jgi:phage-related protein
MSTRSGSEIMRDWLRSLNDRDRSRTISRVLFCVEHDRILVLHGFIEKTRKTRETDMELARKRKREFEMQEFKYGNEEEDHKAVRCQFCDARRFPGR